jgi:hypothetical protein
MRHKGKEKNNARLKNIAVYGVSAALCFAATLIYAYPSIKATTMMYEYSGRLKSLAQIKELNKKMKLELSTRRSYDFVEERAVRGLGFVFPSQGQVAIVAKRK